MVSTLSHADQAKTSDQVSTAGIPLNDLLLAPYLCRPTL